MTIRMNPGHRGAAKKYSAFADDAARQVRQFHATVPGYAPTPLHTVTGPATLLVKDEAYRFGLNAFKALGGSYAMACLLAEQLECPLDFAAIRDRMAKPGADQLTFVTATDGNHGRGVAWSAKMLGQKAVVRMPKGSTAERLEHIRALGADAAITGVNYDETVRLCAELAEKNGWILIQDTAWEGYEQIPLHIMQGYMTMSGEAWDQMTGQMPTHIFLQAGVGSMAAAQTAFFRSLPGGEKPVICVVEPDRADCLFRTAGAGEIRTVTGDMDSIMAGLCCGEPCTLAWDILKNEADAFFSCPDWVAAEGMRLLAQHGITSGESGAPGAGLVQRLLIDPALAEMKTAIGLTEESRVLLFSTEGDTDRGRYREIMAGAWPAPELK